MSNSQPVVPASRRRRRWVMGLLIVPFLVLFAGIILWMVVVWINQLANPAPPRLRPEPNAAFVARLDEAMRGDEPQYLVSLTDFEWTSVSWFPPYGDEDAVELETGITNWGRGAGVSEDQGVWVFCKDGAVVAAISTSSLAFGAPQGTYGPAVQIVHERPGLIGGGDGEAEPDCV